MVGAGDLCRVCVLFVEVLNFFSPTIVFLCVSFVSVNCDQNDFSTGAK